ncbi:MAG: hypothetical protein A2Z02_03950 [Chloroflexi bacterium RBG_16_48_7]|nr:MAG: hypothetical protein A2Z02_03950 [Chloroflexi bacterium RBG_16_48_7]
MFNGGVLSYPAQASSSPISGQIGSKPGSMMADIVDRDKVSDTVTKDLNNLKDKVGNGPGNQPSNTNAAVPSTTTENVN